MYIQYEDYYYQYDRHQRIILQNFIDIQFWIYSSLCLFGALFQTGGFVSYICSAKLVVLVVLWLWVEIFQGIAWVVWWVFYLNFGLVSFGLLGFVWVFRFWCNFPMFGFLIIKFIFANPNIYIYIYLNFEFHNICYVNFLNVVNFS